VLRGTDSELRFVHLTGDAGVIRQRMGQRVGHYMPARLLDSQLATLEVPGVDEHVWTFDVADPPPAIVAHIVERLAA
jgi:gluconokinase